jgi:hypothetical protein
MIRDILIGDITSPNNTRDIIIGMNTDLQDVTGIGLRFVRNLIPAAALELGSVISFDFDPARKLHMIICHKLGHGGWKDADKYVRFGMDYLDHLNDDRRTHSIVQIGTGRVGVRDDADAGAIRTAMADSFLCVDLFVYDGLAMEEAQSDREPLRPLFAWNAMKGPVPLQVAA